MSSSAAPYPPTAQAGAGRRKRRSSSPKRRSVSPKRRAASPSRKAAAAPKKAVRKGSYESMTVEQLVKKAKKYGVVYSGLSKSKLIRAIRTKKSAAKKSKKQ